MKTLKLLLTYFSILFFFSCDNKEITDSEKVKFAVPVVKSLSSIRNSVSIIGSKQTNSDGKIYVSQNYLFYIAKEQGIHVYNNQNPASPSNIAFITIDGVHDIAVKGNYLYADNYVDLLVFDISNINNIVLVKTVQNSLYYNPIYPSEVAYYDSSVFPSNDEIVTGYRIEMREKPNEDDIVFTTETFLGSNMNASATNNIGTGGSYAKFQINNNALYIINSFKLNVFNISNPENAFFDKEIYMNNWFIGGEFETLFIQKETLFVGATNGMFTVNADDEFNPYFVGGFSHATACDPVVVNGNTAYITVRGGTSCGAIEDQINVINVSDISNPTLISTTFVNQPYGLGINNNILYVCCGTDGLKLYDTTDSSNLILKNTYQENLKDVIPLNSHLIAVGANKIIQYSYNPNFTLNEISEINF